MVKELEKFKEGRGKARIKRKRKRERKEKQTSKQRQMTEHHQERKGEKVFSAGGRDGRVGWQVKWCTRLRSVISRFSVN